MLYCMMLLYNVCLPLEVFKKISKCLGGACFVLLSFFFNNPCSGTVLFSVMFVSLDFILNVKLV